MIRGCADRTRFCAFVLKLLVHTLWYHPTVVYRSPRSLAYAPNASAMRLLHLTTTSVLPQSAHSAPDITPHRYYSSLSLSLPLQMHRRQTQYLTPALVPQLPAHHAVQPTSNRLSALVNQHTSIIVELDNTAVRALVFLCCADYDGVSDVAAADFVGGADGDGAAGFGTEGALFLDDYYYAVAWKWCQL